MKVVKTDLVTHKRAYDDVPIILVVEDDEGMNSLIQRTLQREGFRTEGALNGKDAIRRVNYDDNVILILDYKLPDMTGRDVVRSLGKINITIPFIIVTGHGDETIAVEMMKMGARDYIIKDSGLVDMIPHVSKRVLKEYEKEKKLANAEMALRFSEEKFSKAFRSSPTLITISSLQEGRFLDVNDAFLEKSGYSKKDVIGRTETELGCWMNQDDRDAMIAILNRDGIVSNQEIDYCVRTGTVLKVLWSAETIDIKGEKCILASILDITLRKKLEYELLQSQKMEAVGQLAGGVAHDFNNILTAIVSYGYLMKSRLKKDDSVLDSLEKILLLANRASTITRGLLSFSRKEYLNLIPVKLNDIVRSSESMLSTFIGEDIRILTKLAEKAPTILADKIQMEQVIINLVTNARDAMQNGGELTLLTDLVAIDDSFIKTKGFGKRGKYALLSISDNGIGMNEDTRQKIFEPFFTTKEVGKGTGLGLSITYGIIKQHNGFINVKSEPGMGAKFEIYIPLQDGGTSGAVALKESHIQGKAETIMLVEDDNTVRESMRMVLDAYGYQVIEAANGREALNNYKKHKDKIQLIVIDVVMPEMNGKETYNEIRMLDKHAKVIFTSGYTADILRKKKVFEEDVIFMSKPIEPKQFLLKVRQLLDKK